MCARLRAGEVAESASLCKLSLQQQAATRVQIRQPNNLASQRRLLMMFGHVLRQSGDACAVAMLVARQRVTAVARRALESRQYSRCHAA